MTGATASRESTESIDSFTLLTSRHSRILYASLLSVSMQLMSALSGNERRQLVIRIANLIDQCRVPSPRSAETWRDCCVIYASHARQNTGQLMRLHFVWKPLMWRDTESDYVRAGKNRGRVTDIWTITHFLNVLYRVLYNLYTISKAEYYSKTAEWYFLLCCCPSMSSVNVISAYGRFIHVEF